MAGRANRASTGSQVQKWRHSTAWEWKDQKGGLEDKWRWLTHKPQTMFDALLIRMSLAYWEELRELHFGLREQTLLLEIQVLVREELGGCWWPLGIPRWVFRPSVAAARANCLEEGSYWPAEMKGKGPDYWVSEGSRKEPDLSFHFSLASSLGESVQDLCGVSRLCVSMWGWWFHRLESPTREELWVYPCLWGSHLHCSETWWRGN